MARTQSRDREGVISEVADRSLTVAALLGGWGWVNNSHWLVCCALLLAACGEAPKKVEAPPPDPTLEASYGQTVAELAAAAKEAKALIAAGKNDAAASVITRAQPQIATVLAAPHPTLAAMEAASDLDELYGQMLLANKNYGWARMLFQKNRSRWTHWSPQTGDTARRRKEAEAAIAECDRAIAN